MHLGGATFKRLCRARELVSELEEALPLEEIARRVGLSRFHLIRQFDAAFGATPAAYRTRMRLERAKLLLAQGYSVTDVCLEVGFASLGTFSRVFRERLGVAPSAYRRRFFQVPTPWQTVLYPGCFSLMGQLPAEAFRNFGEAAGPRPGQALTP